MRRLSLLVCFLLVGSLIGCVPRPRGPLSLHESHSFPVAEGKLVHLDLRSLDADLRVRAGNSIEVAVDLEARSSSSTAARRWVESHTPVFADSSAEHRVTLPRAARATFSIGFFHSKGVLTVTLPPTCRIEIGSASGDVTISGDGTLTAPVHIKTASGDVHVDGGVGQLIVETASGNVRVRRVEIDLLQVQTASGDVRLESGAHKVAVDTASGDVRLEGLTGGLTAEASSGDVTASWRSVPRGEKIRIRTSSGEVTLRLPSDTTLAGEARTRSGSLRSSFEGVEERREKAIRFAAAVGGVELDVSTGSGDIVIRHGA